MPHCQATTGLPPGLRLSGRTLLSWTTHACLTNTTCSSGGWGAVVGDQCVWGHAGLHLHWGGCTARWKGCLAPASSRQPAAKQPALPARPAQRGRVCRSGARAGGGDGGPRPDVDHRQRLPVRQRAHAVRAGTQIQHAAGPRGAGAAVRACRGCARLRAQAAHTPAAAGILATLQPFCSLLFQALFVSSSSSLPTQVQELGQAAEARQRRRPGAGLLLHAARRAWAEI